MKIVCNVLYVHKNSLQDLPFWAIRKVNEATKRINDWNYTIIAVGKDFVSFIQSDDFDTNFEPTVGDRLKVTETQVTQTKASKTNPQIFHRRHLFVNENIPQGFDIAEDKKRVASWEVFKPDNNRMGRLLWWKDFLKANALS